MPSRSTALVVQLLRRLFICRHGHAYMLRLSPDIVWLECTGCLSVRIIDRHERASQARVSS
jgi:hypothetical protein